jgi:hypothetical protein
MANGPRGAQVTGPGGGGRVELVGRLGRAQAGRVRTVESGCNRVGGWTMGADERLGG